MNHNSYVMHVIPVNCFREGLKYVKISMSVVRLGLKMAGHAEIIIRKPEHIPLNAYGVICVQATKLLGVSVMKSN